MTKDFMKWHCLKASLEAEKSPVFFNEREIWFAYLGANLGHEQDGKGGKFLRPIVVLKKFNQDICWVIPLTTTEKISPYYHLLTVRGNKSCALLSQLRLIDKKRFFQKIGIVPQEEFEGVRQKIIALLAP